MKKYSILALTLVLTAALFTGCGCTNRNVMPTTVPTTHATTAPTQATTEMTTAPTHETTHNTEATIDRGNGPLEDHATTTPTDGTTEGRARQYNSNVR